MDLIYLGGIRLSTVILIAAFVVAGFITKQPRYRALVACATWLFGFETAWQLFGIGAAILRSGHPAESLHTLFGPRLGLLLHQAIYYGPGPILAVVAHLIGVRVEWRLAVATVVIWIVWLATGFHSNTHTLAGFDPLAEVLNEAAKTAWGLAYLVPLLITPSRSAGGPERARG